MSTAATRQEPSISLPEERLTPVTSEAIAELAYAYWEARGRPLGSPEEDWFRAEQDLQYQRSGADITGSS